MMRWLVLSIGLFACHHDAKPAAPVRSSESGSAAAAPAADDAPARGEHSSVTKIREFKERACACKTTPCVDDVQQDLQAWAMHDTDSSQPSDADTKTADELMKQFEKCVLAAGGKL